MVDGKGRGEAVRQRPGEGKDAPTTAGLATDDEFSRVLYLNKGFGGKQSAASDSRPHQAVGERASWWLFVADGEGNVYAKASPSDRFRGASFPL
jgi:hypothetical protein